VLVDPLVCRLQGGDELLRVYDEDYAGGAPGVGGELAAGGGGDDERAFQEQVLSGPPPLGPGAAPLDRLIAYGRARVGFLIGHREIARAALDGSQPVPAGSQTPLSQLHIRILLGQIPLGAADLDVLAVQLTAALDGPLLLYLSESDLTEAAPKIEGRIAQSWQDLVQRVCRPQPASASPTRK
jgi:hypothetical protein